MVQSHKGPFISCISPFIRHSILACSTEPIYFFVNPLFAKVEVCNAGSHPNACQVIQSRISRNLWHIQTFFHPMSWKLRCCCNCSPSRYPLPFQSFSPSGVHIMEEDNRQQNDKIKNKVLKLTAEVLGIRIDAAQRGSASDLAAE